MHIKGIGVCGGMVVAPPHYVERPHRADPVERSDLPVAEQEARLAELTVALCDGLREKAAALRMRGAGGEAEMLEMQAVMLRDGPFQSGIRAYLTQGYSLAAAVERSAADQQEAILATGDPYLMERVSDVADMATRLEYAVWGRAYPDLSGLDRDAIVVAEDLQPSMLVSADPDRLKGMVLGGASRTSHIAILAAGRELPAVVGCGDLTALAKEIGECPDGELFLDAEGGTVSFGMAEAERVGAVERVARWRRERSALEVYRDCVCVTADGKRVWLYGNIMEAGAADKVNEYGGDGVGLFRTEFLYMNRSTLPGEEEQFGHYRAAARKLAGKSITIRTMDIGADKQTPALDLGREENPFLGFRAIRVCLARPELFRTQLRAILRASAFGKVKIMFPMISRMAELDRALELLEAAKAELRSEGKAFDEEIKVGIMVEVPSVAILARDFIRKVDFFSIGSNDLTQYTLAVDRMNDKIAPLYDGLDRAVLGLIHNVVRAVEEAGTGKTCSLCGELGADPSAIPILLGLGLRHISVNPSAILRTKKLISGLNADELRKQLKQSGQESQ